MPGRYDQKNLRIYVVEIKPTEACNRGVWYFGKAGKLFHCVIGIRETEKGRLHPAFYVVDFHGDKYMPPSQILTIRLEDAEVFYERNIRPGQEIMGFVCRHARMYAD